MPEPENNYSLAQRGRLMIVILALGFAIPWLVINSGSLFQRWVEREAFVRLQTLGKAIEDYRKRTGHYPPVMRDVGEINRVLGTRLDDTEQVSLSCLNLYGLESECQAVTVYGWGLHISNHHLDFAPHCVSVVFGWPCPTCHKTGCYKK